MTAVIAVITITGIQSCQTASKASTTKMLKFNPQKGTGYDYEMVWDMEQKIMGNDTKISIGALYSMNVTDDNGSEKTLTTTYKSFRMHMKMMGMELDVDTDKPAPPMTDEEIQQNPMGLLTRAFSGIAGKSFIIKVDAEGKVLEVSGFEQIVKSMVDSFGIESIREQVQSSLKDQFSDQTIKDQFAQLFTIFPNKEVKIGDSWDKSYTVGGKMPAKFDTKFTVKAIEGDIVTLDTKTTISPSEAGGMGEMKGSQTGTLLVDSKSGLVVNADFDQQMEVKTNGMSFDMHGKGKIKGKAN